jgi:hypothetical protein
VTDGGEEMGIPVTDDDARTIVDLLLRVGRAHDLTEAAAGSCGIDLYTGPPSHPFCV